MIYLKKYLPTQKQLNKNRILKFFGNIIFEPNLWHFNRHSVSFAVLVGTFCCFLPIPLQMLPCVLLVAWIRCNLPLSIGIVWLSNPVTMPPMMYSTYLLGLWILGEQNQVTEVNISFTWLAGQIAAVWQPLLLGSLLTGTLLGILGFIVVRIYWRWKVARDQSMRKLKNKLRAGEQN